MLQQEEPKDFVIATGKTYSVREFVERVFEYLGLDWESRARLGEVRRDRSPLLPSN